MKPLPSPLTIISRFFLLRRENGASRLTRDFLSSCRRSPCRRLSSAVLMKELSDQDVNICSSERRVSLEAPFSRLSKKKREMIVNGDGNGFIGLVPYFKELREGAQNGLAEWLEQFMAESADRKG